RRVLSERLRASSLPFDMFLDDVERSQPLRVPGTAVFMSGNAEGTPLALLHNLKHNKVLHERVILLTLASDEVPHVNPDHRVRVEKIREGFYRIRGRYGFMEEPSVPQLLNACKSLGLEIRMDQTTFFLSRETI